MTLYLHTEWSLDDCKAVLEFLRAMHAEVGRVPLDDSKALNTIAETARNGVAYTIRDDDDNDRIVASIGLTRNDFWYAHEEFIGEVWLYVDPAHRDGEALGLLLNECCAIATKANMLVLIDHHRPRRPNGTTMSIMADRYEFRPTGRIVAIEPEKDRAHVLQDEEDLDLDDEPDAGARRVG